MSMKALGLAAAAVLLASVSASAQTTTATLEGVVTDVTGASLPDATVVAPH